jgi:hypothetical protein
MKVEKYCIRREVDEAGTLTVFSTRHETEDMVLPSAFHFSST